MSCFNVNGKRSFGDVDPNNNVTAGADKRPRISTGSSSESRFSVYSDDEFLGLVQESVKGVYSMLSIVDAKENGPLAAKLLYRIDPAYLDCPKVKKVETVLRNRWLLNRENDTNLTLTTKDEQKIILAHKSILALESPHFRAMKEFSEFQAGTVEVGEEYGPRTVEHVLDYLYLSDEKRKAFASTVNKGLLPSIAALSHLWAIEQLTRDCDEELCNSLAELDLENSEIDGLLDKSPHLKKFVMLFQFMKRLAIEGELNTLSGELDNLSRQLRSQTPSPDQLNNVLGCLRTQLTQHLAQLDPRSREKSGLEPVIEQMQTPEGAAQLAEKCTPEERALFATLKTEFGKACGIPTGTFGKEQWEKTFPVTIEEVPPLPANIHAILEQEDPCEPGKKLKETCTLFLRPQKVILREEDGSEKELLLSLNGVEELAKKATNPRLRTKYFNEFPNDRIRTLANELRAQVNGTPAAESGWVLMRKEVIPDSRMKSFVEQQVLLKGEFEVPKIMDAIL